MTGAFLQVLEFETLRKMTGEPIRRVFFDFPQDCMALVRTLAGLATFNSVLETFELLKPGYGLRDAPRLWRLRLGQILEAFQLHCLSVVKQIYILIRHSRLVLLISIHVDDLKGAGEPSVITRVQGPPREDARCLDLPVPEL